MNITERTTEIYKKQKRWEKLTLDEQMLYDMDIVLFSISEILVDCSKENISCNIGIERIRNRMGKLDKNYEED